MDKNIYQIDFIQLLTLVFINCKLNNSISWSWFWVISPIFFGLIVAIAVQMVEDI